MKATAVKVTPEIQYRRMLNRLNLETREKIADLEMFYPFDTFEKRGLLNEINQWKQSQIAHIYAKCYNPKPTFLDKLFSFFNK